MKRMLIPYIILITFLFLHPFATSGQHPSGTGRNPAVTILEPKKAYELIRDNNAARGLVILDIRTPGEFKTGHLGDAVNVDYRSGIFVQEIGKLDRQKTYLVYCRIGRRSAGAIDIMTRLGFKKFIQIAGDIEAWKAAGLPLVKKK